MGRGIRKRPGAGSAGNGDHESQGCASELRWANKPAQWLYLGSSVGIWDSEVTIYRRIGMCRYGVCARARHAWVCM